MVVVDEAFKNAGKAAGVEIWRVKNFRLLPVPTSEQGVFYSGDSYIVLSTYGSGPHYSHNVHMWIGDESSADESGTAAIKTVELDDLLGGGPVQYREVQNHESSLFLSLFRKGIRYMKGGFESGFKHAGKAEQRPRLFHCKGKRTVRVSEVEMSRDSLNLGDAFILDAGAMIYAWLPPNCNHIERIKGVEQARNIKDQERAGKAEIQVLDTDWETNSEFWKYFPGNGRLRSASEGGSDDDLMKSKKINPVLYKISDATGRLKVDKVADGTLDPSMLDSKDAFMLDAASTGVFVWIGKGCTGNERKSAMSWALEYMKSKGLPAWVQVVRVLEGAEPSIFTQWFASAPTLLGQKGTSTVQKTFKKKFEPRLFHCSDASGKLSINEISNFTQNDLQPDDVMILDTGTSVFLWIGKGANETEKQAGGMIAKKYLELSPVSRPGYTITNISQGAEPSEFKGTFPNWDPNIWKEQSHLEQSVGDALKNLRF